MADEIRLQANERFDLVDMTRLNAFIQDAFSDILGNILGDYLRYSGAAADANKRPVIIRNFKIAYTPSTCDITVSRTWLDTGVAYKALIYDKDGRRLTGPNSAVSKLHVANPAPAGTHYLMARRVATDDTPETRRFYNETTGKYTQTIDTRTIDDWEIGDAAVDPETDATLAAAGWLRIGVYTSDGTYVTATVESIATWASGNMSSWSTPGGPPDYDPQNILGVISSMYTVLQYMRDGVALDDPRYDACFDREGGIRFAKGVTGSGGKQNVYERLTPKTTPDTLKLQTNAPTNADDLHYYRAQGFIAGANTGDGGPGTASRRGFCYARSLNVESADHLADITKNWSVPAASYMPGPDPADNAYTPWKFISLGQDNTWQFDTATTTCGWWLCNMHMTTTDPAVSNWLIVPLSMPDKCRLYCVDVWFNMRAVIIEDESIRLRLYKRAYGSTETIMDEHLHGWGSGPGIMGAWPAPGASYRFRLNYESNPALRPIIDNSAYSYAVAIRRETECIIDEASIALLDTNVITEIREASHVY